MRLNSVLLISMPTLMAFLDYHSIVSPIAYTSEPSMFNLPQIESLPVTASKLTAATRIDQVLSRVFRYVTRGWPNDTAASLAPYAAKRTELTVEGGCVLWGTWVVVPEKWREKLLLELHRDHPGICKMKSFARSYMWWPGMDKNIEDLAKSCLDIQAVKKAPVTAMGVALSCVTASPRGFCWALPRHDVFRSCRRLLQVAIHNITIYVRSLRCVSEDEWCTPHSKCAISSCHKRPR